MVMVPALLAVLLLELLALVALGLGLAGALRTQLGWQPAAATSLQLKLERLGEEVSALGRLGMALHVGAAVLWLIALNHVLPALVPGAMCGVGVMQAMPGAWTALAMRAVAAAALVAWSSWDRLNRDLPTGPLAQHASRALLVAVPLAAVASWQTLQALLHLNVHQPVSCCAAVYDLAVVAASSLPGPRLAGLTEAVALAALGLGVALAALRLWRSPDASRRAPWKAWLLAGATVLWAALQTWVLIDVVSPYVYRALGHRCPLCLLLPEHGAVGYLQYGTLLGSILIAVRIACLTTAARQHPTAAEPAKPRIRRAAVLMAILVLVQLVAAAFPVAWWRIRFGVWIDG